MLISDEINYWELFGLEQPQESDNTADTADPPGAPNGENDPESADPDERVEDPQEDRDDGADGDDSAADESGEQERDDQESDEQSAPGNNDKKPEQSKSERAKQAAARRKREQEAAIKAAVDAALNQEREANNKKLEDFFARAGFKDPTNGNKEIKSIEEYLQYQQNYAIKQAEAELKRGKLSAETIQAIVENTPVVKQAQAVIQQAEAEKKRAAEEAQQARVHADLAEIQKIDPTIQNLGDLLKAENGQKIYELVQRGNTLVDAYRLANFDRLTAKAATAAKAQSTNAVQSKQHLRSTTTRGSGSADVPAGDMAYYKALMPEASEAEIRKHYNAYIKTLQSK